MSGARTAVVTDTTAYLTDELAAELGITRVSLYVTLEGEQRPESEIAASAYPDFYRRLRESEGGATTSQPSVGDFVSAYEPLLADGGEIVSVHIGASISGTCDSARQAGERLAAEGKGGERVHVVDSRSAAGGLAFVALAAARAAERGERAAAAAEAAERVRDQLEIWFALDTLEYLRKGGRIGAAQAWIGSALKVKPILTLKGEITPVERVRTGKRAFERLVAYAEERREADARTWIVQHIRNPDGAERLVSQCREILGTEPVLVSEVGPVLGTHAGPGMLGFGSVPNEALD